MDQLLLMPFLVAIVAIVVLIGLPILTWVLFRLLAHRERMAMIRHGYAPPDARSLSAGARTPYAPDPVANMQLRRGVSVAFIGLALLIGLSFVSYHDGRIDPGPWLLGGLVPLFVGLAQMVNAMIGGARFGATRAGGAPLSRFENAAQPPYEEQRSESQRRPPV